MKGITLAATLLLAVAVSARAEIHGAWVASKQDAKPGRIYMSMMRTHWGHQGNTMKLADFAGLSDAQLASVTQVPVQFQLRRDAGTITFEGTFKNGDGAGQFTFAPNGGYANAVRAAGVEFNLRRNREPRPEEEDLFTLAMVDLSTAYIRSMQAEGYKETLDRYMKMRMFDVTPEFIHQLKDAGYSNVPAEKLIRLKIHGVDIDYINKMNALTRH